MASTTDWARAVATTITNYLREEKSRPPYADTESTQ
jgi:hypothetical protein